MRAVAVVVLVLAVGCSTPADDDTLRASAPPPTASATPSPTPSPTPPVPLGDEPVQFSTPTRNIGCYVSREFAQCDITQKTWTAPPKPADCELDWAHGLVVRPTGRAEFVCAGDTVLGSAKVVQYGGAVRVGDLQCVVSQQGVECFSDTTNRGFTLSRTSYTIN